MAQKPPKKKRRKFDLHKALFVLPNAFTASSILCGFLAITRSASGTMADLTMAAWFIILGALFDATDGRVARLTKTQSEFGREFDSLADVITFGVAPGILVYNWQLKEFGDLGLFLSFAYAACGAIRLARFNVVASRETGPSYHFTGLPIPGAAAAVVSLLLATHGSDAVIPPTTLAAVVVILSFLMVSTVRYRTFKNFKIGLKSMAALVGVGASMAYVTLTAKLEVAVMLSIWGYLLMGMLEEVVFFRPRRRVALAARDEAERLAELAASAAQEDKSAAPKPAH